MSRASEVSIIWINNTEMEVRVVCNDVDLIVPIAPSEFSEIQVIPVAEGLTLDCLFTTDDGVSHVQLAIQGTLESPEGVVQCFVASWDCHNVDFHNSEDGWIYRMSLRSLDSSPGFVIVGTVELDDDGKSID